MPIDTHETYKQLLEAGVPEPQADAHARIFGQWTEEKLVTREYLDLRLRELAKDLRQEIADVRDELKRDIAALRAELGDVRGEIEGLRAEFKRDLQALELRIDARFKEQQTLAEQRERRLLNRIIAVVGAATTILGTLIGLLGFLLS